MLYIRLSRCRSNGKICRGDEGEQHDEAEECECEEKVDADRSDEEHETSYRPILRSVM